MATQIFPGQKLRIAVNAKYQGIRQDIGYELYIDTRANIDRTTTQISSALSKTLNASISPIDVSFQWPDLVMPSLPAGTLLSVRVKFWCGTDQSVCGSMTWDDIIQVVGSSFSGYGIVAGVS